MKKLAEICLSLLLFLFMVHNTLGYTVDSISFENGLIISVELSKTPMELQAGLMYRDNLAPNHGMLFSFNSEDKHGFWMKNMNFVIDIIWIDSNLAIVDITRGAVPCTIESCEVYKPSIPSRHVLEVPGGFAVENEVRVGQKVLLIQNGKTQ
jgi:uncharacterized membrane protein (UPF0127 family)